MAARRRLSQSFAINIIRVWSGGKAAVTVSILADYPDLILVGNGGRTGWLFVNPHAGPIVVLLLALTFRGWVSHWFMEAKVIRTGCCCVLLLLNLLILIKLWSICVLDDRNPNRRCYSGRWSKAANRRFFVFLLGTSGGSEGWGTGGFVWSWSVSLLLLAVVEIYQQLKEK